MSYESIRIDGKPFAPMARWDQGRDTKGSHTPQYNLLRAMVNRGLLADATIAGRTFVDESQALRLLSNRESEVRESFPSGDAMANKADAICAALNRIAVALEKLIEQEGPTAEA